MSDNPKFEGFSRVVINFDGEAVSHSKAEEMGVEPDVGFLRDDGWALGAPKELEDVAYRMWADKWTHIIRKPQTEWMKL
jgi:hypothetical protein